MRRQISYKNTEKNRYVESKQHATQQSMCYWGSKRGNQKVLCDKWKMETQQSKTYGTQQTVLRG